MESYTYVTTNHIYRGSWVVWYIADLLELLLLLRFSLRLFGANPNAPFTSFVYQLTYPLVSPFFGVFGATPTQSGLGVFEWNSLLAMLVYYLVAVIVVRLFFTVRTVSSVNDVAI